MPHSPEDKKRILTRVRRIRGQVDALERAPNRAISSRHFAANRHSGAANGLMGEMVEIHLKDELVTGRPPRISGLCGWRKSAIYCALI